MTAPRDPRDLIHPDHLRYIREVVLPTIPPLSPEKRAKLAILLNPPAAPAKRGAA